MHDFKSLQLDDEDSSIYFINYISDGSDSPVNNYENESVHSPDDNDDIDVSSLPNSLIITPVPQELFTNQQLKDEFEQLFRIYDLQITVLYLKFFQRVRITFTSSSNALQARLNLHEHPFHGTIIKTYFACPIIFRGANPDTYLRPPEPEKLFLISPPASPPVGWEQKLEDPPVVDLNFFSAIAQLQPSMLKIGERKDKLEIWSLQIPSSQRIQAHQSHELAPSELGSKAPVIIIHTCDDDNNNNNEENHTAREKLIKPTLIQTKRPPKIEGLV